MSDAEDGPPPSPRPEEGARAADSACWLERVCYSCGALADGPPEPVCERCGSPHPAGPQA